MSWGHCERLSTEPPFAATSTKVSNGPKADHELRVKWPNFCAMHISTIGAEDSVGLWSVNDGLHSDSEAFVQSAASVTEGDALDQQTDHSRFVRLNIGPQATANQTVLARIF